MSEIKTLKELETLYGDSVPNVFKKETAMLTPEYRRWLEVSPFFAFASIGDRGLDCSPRGDKTDQLLRVLDSQTLAIPDRRGNNRLDTLKNLIIDPRVSLLFLIPGINETLRIKGKATITTDPALINSFDMGGKKPATVILVAIEAVYFQCARALKRASLWDAEAQVQKGDVPTAGQMVQGAVADFDGAAYDSVLNERQKQTLY
jgi:PPOX class probable FMN-dependent enzyme